MKNTIRKSRFCIQMITLLMLTLVLSVACKKRRSMVNETDQKTINSEVICSPDNVCLDLSEPKETVPKKAFDQAARDRFQLLLKNQAINPSSEITNNERSFLKDYGLEEQFSAYLNTHSFYKPFLRLLNDKEFQESKSREKLSQFSRHIQDRISSLISPKILEKQATELQISDQSESLNQLAAFPPNLSKLSAVLHKVIPSLTLILTLTMAAFLGVMNAQCFGIMEQTMGERVDFVKHEETFDPKKHVEMFFYDCAAGTPCIHTAVRLEDTIFHGSGPNAGTGSLALPEGRPLSQWNGTAQVFATSYEDFKTPKNDVSLTSIRLELPEAEILNLKKYYANRYGHFYNYWAFPPVSTCTTVAYDAFRAGTSVTIPPVIQDYPGSYEVYLKLLKVFGDERIVSVVRNQGNNILHYTPKQIMANRAKHLGIQSAVMLATFPSTLFQGIVGKNIHFPVDEVFSFKDLYFSDTYYKKNNSEKQPALNAPPLSSP